MLYEELIPMTNVTNRIKFETGYVIPKHYNWKLLRSIDIANEKLQISRFMSTDALNVVLVLNREPHKKSEKKITG